MRKEKRLMPSGLCQTACENRERYWNLIKKLMLKTFSSPKKEAVIKGTVKKIVLMEDNRDSTKSENLYERDLVLHHGSKTEDSKES
jgi:hypothetical protein